MGVQLYALDRRTVPLQVGGVSHHVGTLRYVAKLNELDEERAAALVTATPFSFPLAALVVPVTELPLATAPEVPVAAHAVIGWDEGRQTVVDLEWDLLPVLGYAVREKKTGAFVLHELVGNVMQPITRERAVGLKLLDENGMLICHGQPRITSCKAVRPYIPDFVQADCILDDGTSRTLLVRLTGSEEPSPSWFPGRQPRQSEIYPASSSHR